jgi:hypothetical protein
MISAQNFVFIFIHYNFMHHFFPFWRKGNRLMRSPSLSVWLHVLVGVSPLFTFWTKWANFRKLGVIISILEVILTSSSLNVVQPTVLAYTVCCLCDYYMPYCILLYWVRILLLWVCIILCLLYWVIIIVCLHFIVLCLVFIALCTYYFMLAFYCIVFYYYIVLLYRFCL